MNAGVTPGDVLALAFLVLFLVVLVVVPIVWWFDARRERREKAQERAELITMGLLYGIEYVPGENLDDFRLLVMQARAKAAEKEGRRA